MSPGTAGVKANTAADPTALELEKPDGSTVYDDGTETAPEPAQPETTIIVTKAPTGTYTVRVWTNAPAGTDASYKGTAKLAIAGAGARGHANADARSIAGTDDHPDARGDAGPWAGARAGAHGDPCTGILDASHDSDREDPQGLRTQDPEDARPRR